MHKSLIFRFVVSFVVMQISMLSLLIVDSGRLISSKNAASFEAQVKSHVELISAMLAESLAVFDVARLDDNLKTVSEFSQVSYISVFTSGNKKIAFIGQEPDNFLLDHSYQDAKIDSVYDATKDIVIAGQVLGKMRIGFSISDVEQITQDAIIHNSVIAAIEILLSVALTVILGVYLIRRINTLKEGAIALRNDQLDYRIPVTQNDELGDLAKTFNQLAISLEHSRTTVVQQYEKLQKMHDKALSATKAKSNFLANMSHEIRTPMNAILGYTQLLYLDEAIPDKQKKKISKILRSGNHLLKIINEILDISKIESGRVELSPVIFDLNETVQNLSDMFSFQCSEKGLEWNCLFEVESEHLTVFGDDGKLCQVLVNLLGNAIKFTEKGGVTLQISYRKNNNYSFDIIDSGIGISEVDKLTIFQAFNQGDAGNLKGGTGLGLSISKNLLQLMGGELEVKSELNSGSHFSFSLYLEKGLESVIQSKKQTDENIFSKTFHLDKPVSALVVDDNVDNRVVLKQMLISLGCSCTDVDNGYSAVDDLALCQYDIIFMDYKMPEIDGIATTKLIRSACGELPKIVMTTAAAFDHDLVLFNEAGADAILRKPITIDELCKSLSQQAVSENIESAKKINNQITVENQNTSDHNICLDNVPETLLNDIAELAELGQITDLNLKINELVSVHKELGERLLDYSANMKLDDITHEINRRSVL